MKLSVKKIVFTLAIVPLVLMSMNAFASTPSEGNYDYLANTSSTLLDSNLFTHVDSLVNYDQGIVDMTHYTQVLENNQVILYINEDTFAIRIQNKETGYIWSSDLINMSQYSLNNTYKRRSQSAFSISFIDDENRTLSKDMLESDLSLTYEVNPTQQTVTFHVDLLDYSFRIAYTIQLNGGSLTFHMNRSDIEEYGTNRLIDIDFYEFLGAAHLDDISGYNFIPSNNGALVRYTAVSPINSEYKARFYGQDQYYSADSAALDFPVYGYVQGINHNALFVDITKGEEFAMYHYLPAGYKTEFHIQYTSFYYREIYQLPIAGLSQSPSIVESNLKNTDLEFKMTVLSNEDANYVGMAKTYKNELVQSGLLNKAEGLSDHVGLNLDVLGSDYEQGIFFKKNYNMTTTQDILSINDDLTTSGVQNIFYTLMGFNEGGYTDSSYANYSFNRKLGSPSDLKNLDVAYYYNPTISFQTKDKVARNTLVTIKQTYARGSIFDGDYYMSVMDIKALKNTFPKAYKTLNSYGGIALDGLSNMFYSDKYYTRDEMYAIYGQLVDQAIPMVQPNQVMLPFTSKYLNMPLQHERLKFFTDSVPFVSIVLSGYVPYYSTYLNFSANMNLDVLKVIDFGANPSYLITKQPSYLLTNTLAREFYGSYYGNLESYIERDYQKIDQALNGVLNQEILNRVVLAEGIVDITYANNTQIIVNYTGEDYSIQGNETVPAFNYLVLGS